MEHYDLENYLRESESLDVVPSYDGQKLDLRGDQIVETDLLAELPWIAVSEQVHGGLPPKNGSNKVKSMV